MFLSQDPVAQTTSIQCLHCRGIQVIHTDPATGSTSIHGGETISTPPCPNPCNCLAHQGGPCGSRNFYTATVPAWECGTGPHPGSLLGQQLPGGNIVTEHAVGYSLHPDKVAHAQRHAAVLSHSNLAAALTKAKSNKK